MNQPITQLDKPAKTPCKHLTASGCGIYEDRFPVCREYGCLWLWGEGSLEDRPDRMGAMPTMSDNGLYLTLYLNGDSTPEQLSRGALKWLRRYFNKTGRPALVLHGDGYGKTTAIYPDGTYKELETKWVGELPGSMEP